MSLRYDPAKWKGNSIFSPEHLSAMRLSPILLLLCFWGCSPEPGIDSINLDLTHVENDSLTGRLRTYYFARDFEGGVVEGRHVLDETHSLQSHAWYLINLARYRETEQAAREAQKLVDNYPESPWSWFALAGTAYQLNARRSSTLIEEVEKPIDASAMALSLRPGDPDVQFFHSQVLRTQSGPERALQFLDSLEAVSMLPAYLLISRAQALYDLAGDNTPARDQAMIDSSFATYSRARILDSTLVDAYVLPGNLHVKKNRTDEGKELLQTARRLSPYSAGVQLDYGHAIYADRSLDNEAKSEILSAIVDEMLALRPDSPDFLDVAVDLYGDVNDVENMTRMEDRLLDVEPEGPRSEWVLLNRIRRFQRENQEALTANDSTAVSQYRDMMRVFSERDWLIREGLLGEVYRRRFYAVDSTVNDDELLAIVRGMADYEKLNLSTVFHRGPILLAERGAHYREAEAIANRGFEAFRQQVEMFRAALGSEADYKKALTQSAWWGHDAIGWIYFNEGRLAEAEQRLATAYDLTEGNNLDVLLHLGQLYEKRYDTAVAQQAGDASEASETLDSESLFITAFNYYKQAASVQVPYGNPGEDALKSLYTKRNGSPEGFEEFLAVLESDDSAERKIDVLAARLEQQEEIKPFELAKLEGDVVSKNDLIGKVVAINVWSTTCGPCLLEMPDLQALYEKYRDDPEVLLLTITDDANPEDAREWIKERNYTLPVLVDDGFLDRMNVRAYPTTWFIDRSGRIVYEKIGWSKYLVEEFSWRIEDLR